MKAYHNDPDLKAAILKQLERHRLADELVKGQYWEDGKGCAVGCTIYSDNHMEYETGFGIPVMLARLEDCIFEGLPNDQAKLWPEHFMSAIEPGQDLSLIGWQFLHWILTDETVTPGITHELVKHEVKQCADVIADLAKGKAPDARAASAAESAARGAARGAAESATESAAWCAWRAAASAAWSAAWSVAWGPAASAAGSVAERAAWSAGNAAESAAASAAEGAAWGPAASAAWSAAWSAAYTKMADKLIELIKGDEK